MNRRVAIAGVWGALIGALSSSPGTWTVLSGHLAIAVFQVVLGVFMMSGLMIAAMVGSLIPAVVINAAINFGLCYFMLRFVPALKPKAVAE